MTPRITILIVALALALAGCSGDAADTTNEQALGTTSNGSSGSGSGTIGDDANTDVSPDFGTAPAPGLDDQLVAPEAADRATAPGGLSTPIDPEVAPRSTTSTWSPNPWVRVVDDPASTFGLDVDTISYSRIREAVDTGRRLDPRAVRVEEVVNALDYDYTTGDEVFSVTSDGARWPWASAANAHLMRIGLATSPVEVRDPANLVFVIDVSGSMTSYLPMVKDSLGILVDNLQPGVDTVGIVTYGTTASVLLDATDVADRDRILGAIESLETNGSTNLAEGLVLGYGIADRMANESDGAANHRVILLSDGIANTGVTDGDQILRMIADGAGNGIELLTVGFGLQGFNDPLMEQLADEGDGLAAYIDNPDQANEVFSQRLSATLQTVAVESRSQVVFNPQVVSEYRLIGYENRDIADEDFRNDSIDAGEVGAGHSVTALYEVTLVEGAATTPTAEVATVSLRWLDPDSRQPTEDATTVTVADIDQAWESATAGLRLAGTTAAWAEVLRGSPHATANGLDSIIAEAELIARTVDSEQLSDWARVVAGSPSVR